MYAPKFSFFLPVRLFKCALDQRILSNSKRESSLILFWMTILAAFNIPVNEIKKRKMDEINKNKSIKKGGKL